MQNHSNHNIVYLSFSVTDFNDVKVTKTTLHVNKCNWNKASNLDVQQYQLNLNDNLSAMNITGDTYSCTTVIIIIFNISMKLFISFSISTMVPIPKGSNKDLTNV